MYIGAFLYGTCSTACSHMYTLYTVFITIFPIPYYKFYLNNVYKYFITINIYMLPMLFYPKAGKKCMSFRSIVWGLLPYKTT